MGYSTDFYGEIEIYPPLNEKEKEFLYRFSETRRVKRDYPNEGKYFLSDGTDNWGHDTKNIINQSHPENQPGYWCKWVPNDKGNIEWSGAEKFYDSTEWMLYLIEHFIKKNCILKAQECNTYKEFNFEKHNANGVILALGERFGDIWNLVVKNNKVFKQEGVVKQILLNKHLNITKDMDAADKYELLYNVWNPQDILNFVTFKKKEEFVYSMTESEEVSLKMLNLQEINNGNTKKKLKI